MKMDVERHATRPGTEAWADEIEIAIDGVKLSEMRKTIDWGKRETAIGAR